MKKDTVHDILKFTSLTLAMCLLVFLVGVTISSIPLGYESLKYELDKISESRKEAKLAKEREESRTLTATRDRNMDDDEDLVDPFKWGRDMPGKGTYRYRHLNDGSMVVRMAHAYHEGDQMSVMLFCNPDDYPHEFNSVRAVADARGAINQMIMKLSSHAHARGTRMSSDMGTRGKYTYIGWYPVYSKEKWENSKTYHIVAAQTNFESNPWWVRFDRNKGTAGPIEITDPRAK